MTELEEVVGQVITIGREDTNWHGRFFAHMRNVFGEIDFSRWAETGNWSDRYTVLALVEDDRIVSTVGMTLMTGVIEGRNKIEMMQIGAVATDAGYRKSGAARRLMDIALQQAAGHSWPVLLFANDTVLDFYPRFGFRRVTTYRSVLNRPVAPARRHGLRLDPADADHRHLIGRQAAYARVHGGVLSAIPDPSIIIWHLFNSAISAYQLPADGGIVMIEETDNGLFLAEWLTGGGEFDLELLSGLVERSHDRILFGFVPSQPALAARIESAADPETFMFLRGLDLPEGALHLPDLLTT